MLLPLTTLVDGAQRDWTPRGCLIGFAMAHQVSPNTKDIGHAALAHAFVRKICAPSTAK
jgi:hypothetical protein